jgi:L-seryl-tRNA(Ser) seleniumtransferase
VLFWRVSNYRVIPAIDELRQRDEVRALESRFGADATTDALRSGAEQVRSEITSGAGPATADVAATEITRIAEGLLSTGARGSLRPVINATGVIIHTNLGRAPIAPAAIARLAEVAAGYSNLEYDLAAGARGSRSVHAESLLTALTGAQAAIVVNNNAAAILLILTALAGGREVLISRGELVEIGGGFRVPDVMRQSGAVLREIGTTNRTRVTDYTSAVSPQTALFLRVHPSNFRIEGFTERPSLADLVAGAKAMHVPVIEDLGSGCLIRGLEDEPTVQASIEAGVDLVCFSGDKMLGGPQAGIIAGAKALVDRLRAHPLMRALRADKLTYAILEATLAEYLAGRSAATVPVQRMLHTGAEEIEARARLLGDRLAAGGWTVALVSGSSAVGGGSAPGLGLPTVLLAIERHGQSAAATEAWLRTLDPPIVARIENDRVVLDLRTVLPAQDETLAAVVTI